MRNRWAAGFESACQALRLRDSLASSSMVSHPAASVIAPKMIANRMCSIVIARRPSRQYAPRACADQARHAALTARRADPEGERWPEPGAAALARC